MTFYKETEARSDNDITLGKFLKKLCKKAPSSCQFCKEPMFKHLILYYHRDGYVEVQVELYKQEAEVKLKRAQTNNFSSTKALIAAANQSGNSSDIIMSAECNICKRSAM